LKDYNHNEGIDVTNKPLALTNLTIARHFRGQFLKFKLFLFYNDYKTSYTFDINHARWHQCLRVGGLCVGGNPPV